MTSTLASNSFHDHLARGLHAAAQPLTVLLASLSQEHTESMPLPELRAVAAQAAAEAQRACALFHGLQELLVAESEPPQLACSPILPIVREVAECTYPLFKQKGVSLHWALPGNCPPIQLDRARTTQALFHVLSAALAASAAHDAVEVVLSCRRGESLRIFVATSGRSAIDGQAEIVLSLAIAEANVRGQQGTCCWSVLPFHAEIQLPRADQ